MKRSIIGAILILVALGLSWQVIYVASFLAGSEWANDPSLATVNFVFGLLNIFNAWFFAREFDRAR